MVQWKTHGRCRGDAEVLGSNPASATFCSRDPSLTSVCLLVNHGVGADGRRGLEAFHTPAVPWAVPWVAGSREGLGRGVQWSGLRSGGGFIWFHSIMIIQL